MKAKRQPVRTRDGLILPTQSPDHPMLVDDWGLEMGLGEHNWTAVRVAANGDKRYAVTRIDSLRIYSHAFLGFQGGDHIDRDPMNNRRSNLRAATPSDQVVNQAKRATHRGVPTTSRFKGVARTRSGRWMVLVGASSTNRYHGIYDSEEEAGDVAYHWRVQCFGEFAHPMAGDIA